MAHQLSSYSSLIKSLQTDHLLTGVTRRITLLAHRIHHQLLPWIRIDVLSLTSLTHDVR